MDKTQESKQKTISEQPQGEFGPVNEARKLAESNIGKITTILEKNYKADLYIYWKASLIILRFSLIHHFSKSRLLTAANQLSLNYVDFRFNVDLELMLSFLDSCVIANVLGSTV